MKANMKEVLQKNKWTLISFIAILLIFFSYLQIQNVTEYPHDSKYYSETAAYIVGDGQKHAPDYYLEGYDGGLKINLLNYPETFRGYFWPTVVCLTRGACVLLFHDGYIGWRLIASFMMAIILTWALPVVFGKKINGLKDLVRILLMTAVIIIYWGNFISYPLSDMASFGFMCCGCAFMRLIIEADKSIFKNILYGFLAGLCFYASYNTRAAYLAGVLVAIVFFSVLFKKYKKNLKEYILVLLAALIGATLIAAPQMAINHKYVGSYTPRVMSEQWTGYTVGLGLFKVKEGMSTVKYETYYGKQEDYPHDAILYYDEVGKEICEREGVYFNTDYGYMDWIKTWIKYPLDMCGIYARHLVSYLTPTYSKVFIDEVHTSKGCFMTFAIWLWLLTGVLLMYSLKKRKYENNTLGWNLVILLPMLVQFVSTPEMRYFLGTYMLMYFYLFVKTDYEGLRDIVKKKRVDVVIVLLVIYVLWITIAGTILIGNEVQPMLINDKYAECVNNVAH